MHGEEEIGLTGTGGVEDAPPDGVPSPVPGRTTSSERPAEVFDRAATDGDAPPPDGAPSPRRATGRKRPAEVFDLTATDGDEDAPRPDAVCFWPFSLLESAKERYNPPAWTSSFPKLTAGDWDWVLMSNYPICQPWLLSACPCLAALPTVLIANDAANPHAKWHSLVHVVYPPLPFEYGSNHAKFMLLFGPTGVRIILGSANFQYHDTRECTQGVWTQDFPLKASAKASARLNAAPSDSDAGESQFGRVLEAYLLKAWKGDVFLQGGDVFDVAAYAQPNAVSARSVNAYDFSGARAHLLASVPGRFTEADGVLDLWGQAQLGALLRAEPCAEHFGAADELVLQASSFASHGRDGGFFDSLCATMSIAPGGPARPAPLRAHLVWPTVGEVRASDLGYAAGVSLPSDTNEVGKAAKSARFCRWTGPGASSSAAHAVGRARTIGHLKSYARFSPVDKRVAWVAITSANVSMAAWGKYENMDKQRGVPTQLFLKSYEIGVLITPSTLARGGGGGGGFDCQARAPSARARPQSAVASAPVAMVPVHEARYEPATAALLAAGAAQLPLPYSLPPAPYERGDVPWCLRSDRKALSYAVPDQYGAVVGRARLYGRDDHGGG